jgi:hypothetical protein
MTFFPFSRSIPVRWLRVLVIAVLALYGCQTRLQIPASKPGETAGTAWGFENGKLHTQPLSEESELQNYTGSLPPTDLDGDGLHEDVRLQQGKLEILKDGQIAWESDQGWQVAQARFADLNQDGSTEIALLVWRDFRPWPVDRYLPNGGRITGFQNAQGQSCHLILIGWKRGRFRELWAGSALAEPLLAFATADLDGDGKEELVALETQYDISPQSPSRSLSLWEWNGFGFTLLDRVKGNFHDLAIIPALNGEALIITH